MDLMTIIGGACAAVIAVLSFMLKLTKEQKKNAENERDNAEKKARSAEERVRAHEKRQQIEEAINLGHSDNADGVRDTYDRDSSQ